MIEWKQRVKQLRWFDVETTKKIPSGELVNILSILKVKSPSKLVIILTRIRFPKSMKSLWASHVDFRRRIHGELTNMCWLVNNSQLDNSFLNKSFSSFLWTGATFAFFHMSRNFFAFNAFSNTTNIRQGNRITTDLYHFFLLKYCPMHVFFPHLKSFLWPMKYPFEWDDRN